MFLGDYNEFIDVKKHECMLTYYMVKYAIVIQREHVIQYFKRMIDLYEVCDDDSEKIAEFQNYLDEFIDTAKYLERIETDYESLCDRFRSDKECIEIMHDNLMSVCKELGYREKSAYYESRKKMLLDKLSELKQEGQDDC